MENQEEQAAIQRAQADPRRFTPLYDHYFPIIYRFVHRRVGQNDLAADLTQEAFLKALLALPRYRDRGLPFRAWLYRIALNEVRMHWRKRKEVVMDISFAEVKGLTSEIGLPLEDDDMQRLAKALARLDESQARLIDLRYMDGLSFAELGQVIGIGEDAAKMRTHRVLAQLRTYLSPRA